MNVKFFVLKNLKDIQYFQKMSKSLPVKYLKEIFQIRVPEEGVLTGETLKGQPFLNRHMYTPSKTAANKEKSSQRFALCLEPMVQLEN